MTTTHPPARILQVYLISEGKASDPDLGAGEWPAYSPIMPDDPDDAVGLLGTVGTNDGRYMSDGEVQIHPGVQIIARGLDDDAVWGKINDIVTCLSQAKEALVTVGSTNYTLHAVTLRGTPATLGTERALDEARRNRRMYVINVTVTISEQ